MMLEGLCKWMNGVLVSVTRDMYDDQKEDILMVEKMLQMK